MFPFVFLFFSLIDRREHWTSFTLLLNWVFFSFSCRGPCFITKYYVPDPVLFILSTFRPTLQSLIIIAPLYIPILKGRVVLVYVCVFCGDVIGFEKTKLNCVPLRIFLLIARWVKFHRIHVSYSFPPVSPKVFSTWMIKQTPIKLL